MFENGSSQWSHLGFELSRITEEDIRGHVQDEVLSQFFGFGHDGDGSMRCGWIKETLLRTHLSSI